MAELPNPVEMHNPYVVEDIFASNADPEGLEDGFMLQLAREDGVAHAYAVVDHGEGELLEMPPAVALVVADIIVKFEAEPRRAAAGARVVKLFCSDDLVELDEPGYTLEAALDVTGGARAFGIADAIGRTDVVVPAEIARSIAQAILDSRPFPIRALN